MVDTQRSSGSVQVGGPAVNKDSALGISVADVSKSFRTGTNVVHALRGCTVDIAGGEFVSVIGPSGCGKSTLLRLVGGLLEPDAGKVEVGGVSPRVNRANKRYGFVPQTPALMPWRTVHENVKLLRTINRRADRRAKREKVDEVELLHRVGLGKFLEALPKQLSGGMQQRVALVRAFALGAPVLLMDEPFAALDEITRNSMRYHLLTLWERDTKTVLFITHSLQEAVMLSDRVVVLAARPGRVTAEFTIDLPRPRHEDMEDTQEFIEHVRNVRDALRAGMD